VIAAVDHNEHDTGSAETENLQRTDQTEPIVNTNDSDKAFPPIAESSEQILSTGTASASSLPDLGEGGPAIVNRSKFTTMKILHKRSSVSRVKYKCELEPLWFTVNLVERAQIGRAYIRSYENGLVREGSLFCPCTYSRYLATQHRQIKP
jgi:hypothetical protein